jgi:hypothetical protein
MLDGRLMTVRLVIEVVVGRSSGSCRILYTRLLNPIALDGVDKRITAGPFRAYHSQV